MQGQMITPWDGGVQGDAVVAWAAQHAMMTGRGLTIVASRTRGGSSRVDLDGKEPFDPPSRGQALPSLARDLRTSYPRLPVEVTFSPDPSARKLSPGSSRADLLVIHSPAGPHLRLVGRVMDLPSGGIDAPVVHVPTPAAASTTTGNAVVVALGSSPAGRRALRSAAQEAIRMACTLVAVAADSGASDLSRRHALTLLQEVLTDLPAVTTEVYWPTDGITRAVTDLSPGARVVVVGNDVGLDRALHPLDPLAATLVRVARSPVIVVGPEPAGEPDGHPRSPASVGRRFGVATLEVQR